MKIPLLKEVTAPIRFLDEIIHAEIQHKAKEKEAFTNEDIYEQANNTHESFIKWYKSTPLGYFFYKCLNGDSWHPKFCIDSAVLKNSENSEVLNIEIENIKYFDKISRLLIGGLATYFLMDAGTDIYSEYLSGNTSNIVGKLIWEGMFFPLTISFFKDAKARYLRDTDTKPRLKDRIKNYSFEQNPQPNLAKIPISRD